jgi:ABC-type sulfate transport system substrate-binding protein
MKENAIDKTLAIPMLVAKGKNKEIHTKPDVVCKEVKILSG